MPEEGKPRHAIERDVWVLWRCVMGPKPAGDESRLVRYFTFLELDAKHQKEYPTREEASAARLVLHERGGFEGNLVIFKRHIVDYPDDV